jgi:hypothetical protein
MVMIMLLTMLFIVCLLGFVSMIYAVARRPKGDAEESVEQSKEVEA